MKALQFELGMLKRAYISLEADKNELEEKLKAMDRRNEALQASEVNPININVAYILTSSPVERLLSVAQYVWSTAMAPSLPKTSLCKVAKEG